MTQFTKVEQKVADDFACAINQPVTPETYGEFIRTKVHEFAYHEAGHAAAHAFTGTEENHITKITIIPDEKALAYCQQESVMERLYVLNKEFPYPMLRALGRCHLLTLLAGPLAKQKATKDQQELNILDIIEDPELYGINEDGDIARSLQLAEAIQKPYMPYYRVLRFAEQWTHEMLSRNDVWDCVETLAEALRNHGTVLRNDWLLKTLQNVSYYFTDPKWKRRLGITPREWDDMVTWV